MIVRYIFSFKNIEKGRKLDLMILICIILVTLEDLALLNDQDPEITPGLFQGDMVHMA